MLTGKATNGYCYIGETPVNLNILHVTLHSHVGTNFGSVPEQICHGSK